MRGAETADSRLLKREMAANGANGSARWQVRVMPEVRDWAEGLDREQLAKVVDALDVLRDVGPTLGRPLVDRIKGAQQHNMKELRPPGAELRVLFAFDRQGDAVLLLGGDKTGQWNRWYKRNVERASVRFEQHQRDSGIAQIWDVTRRTGQRSAERSR